MFEVSLTKHEGKLHVKIVKDDKDNEGNKIVSTQLQEVICGYESYSGWYWFGTEIVEDDEDDTIFFGLVQGHSEKLGYFSKNEVESLIPQLKTWKIKEIDLPFSGRRN